MFALIKNNKVYAICDNRTIELNKEDTDKVLKLNDSFIRYVHCVEYIKDKLIVNLNCVKNIYIKELDTKIQQYIDNTFRELDWGNNEADALASIRNTIDVKLGEILYLLEEDLKAQGKDTSAVTVSSFWKKAALYFAGKYSSDQAIQELQALGVTDETIQKVIPLLEEAISAAALKLWDEQVWDYEEEVEEQIQKATSIEQIDQLMENLNFPPPPGGES